jgi:penicillin-binding protein 1A
MTKRAKKNGEAAPKKKKPKSRRELLILWGTWVAVGSFLAFAMAVLGLTLVFAYYGRDLPSVTALKHYDPPQTSRVLDRKGRVIAELFEERRTVVPMSKIPRVLVLSVLAAEDADFYMHRGLDYTGIVRALIRDALSHKQLQGASTITQQIVKNVLLTPERTIARKVKELILARRLEQELSKDEILHLYLNHINFGHGRYGVQEAARFYFGKDVSQINLAEASLIAGLPQAPSRLSPLKHPEAARQRQQYVLGQLESKRAQYWDDLSLEVIQQARTTPVKLAPEEHASTDAPEVAAIATQILQSVAGADAIKHGGYTVETAIDLDLQVAARKALRAGLVTLDVRNHLQGPLRPPKQKRKPERIKELVVGRSYDAFVTSAAGARLHRSPIWRAGIRITCARASSRPPARRSSPRWMRWPKATRRCARACCSVRKARW